MDSKDAEVAKCIFRISVFLNLCIFRIRASFKSGKWPNLFQNAFFKSGIDSDLAFLCIFYRQLMQNRRLPPIF
jgi:hypothetical protein